MTDDLFQYALRLGDDALIAAQRLAEWSARAPEMEEDIALSNIALDQLGVARAMLTYAGELEGVGRDEDGYAFLREEFGRAWFTRREAGSLLRELWAEGQKPTADELLAEVAGAELDLGAVTERIEETVA